MESLRQARFVFNDPAWKTVSTGAKGFVRGLLKKQPGFRWTAREALDHCADTWGPTFSVRVGGGGAGEERSQGTRSGKRLIKVVGQAAL